MSKGIFDLSSERSKAEWEKASRVLLECVLKRNRQWSEMLNDARVQKTCLGCGSATQPCCGH